MQSTRLIFPAKLICSVILAFVVAFSGISPLFSYASENDSPVQAAQTVIQNKPLDREEIIPESDNLLYLRSAFRKLFNRYFKAFGMKDFISATEIELNKKKLSLPAGTSAIIDADIVPSNSRNKEVTYKSDNPIIATVSSYGQIKALKPGNATVYAVAKDGGFYEKCFVTVTPGSIYCDYLSLSASGVNLEIGETASFDVTIFPVNTTDPETLIVSDLSVVVSTLSDGKLTVTGKASGTSIVTVECGSFYDTLYVNVSDPENPSGGTDIDSVSIFGGSSASNIGTVFKDMKALPDGGYIACGTTASTNGSFSHLYRNSAAWKTPFSYIVKFSETGSIDWIKLFGDSSASVSLYDIAVLSDGSFVAVGTNDTPSTYEKVGGIDSVIIRLSSEGKLISKNILNGAGDDFLYSVAATANGYIVGGKTNSINGAFAGSTGISSVIMNYDLGNTLLWKHFLNSSKSSHIADIDVDGNGDIFIACTTTSTDGKFSEFDGLFGSYADSVILKYSSSGNLLWHHVIATSGTDLFESIAADGNGGCYVAGNYTLVSSTEPNGTLDGIFNCGGTDTLVFRIDGNGNSQWYQTVSGFYDDFITDIVCTADGIAVTGYSDSENRDFSVVGNGGGDDGFVCLLDTNGNKIKIGTQSGTNDDAGLCIAYSSSADEIFVAGRTKSDNGDFNGNTCGNSVTGYVVRYKTSE